MDLTNDAYLILIHGKTFTERYYRDKAGWLKISAHNRKFRMTAEQVINHILPLLAGLKPIAKLEVKHRPKPANKSPSHKHAAKLTKKRPPISK